MMKLFKGCSNMTHIMKCKPIPEGYKLYAMCCAQSGWCYFIVLDGKEKNKKGIAKSVTWMIHHLPDRLNKLYIICMDNYFTLVKLMIATRKCGVACMGNSKSLRRIAASQIY